MTLSLRRAAGEPFDPGLGEAVYTPQADEDLIGIWLYVATDNETAANRLIERLKATCHRIANMPKMGRARPDIAPGMRYLPAGPYLILYREIPDGAEIIRVIHSARQPGSP